MYSLVISGIRNENELNHYRLLMKPVARLSLNSGGKKSWQKADLEKDQSAVPS